MRLFAVIALLTLIPAASAQPAFDVASIRVNDSPGMPDPSIHRTPTMLTIRQVSLSVAVKWAYTMDSFQISGLEGMQGAPFFDIQAKTAGPVSEGELRLMLRTLLAQRFHLTAHIEKKELPVWALLVTNPEISP